MTPGNGHPTSSSGRSSSSRSSSRLSDEDDLVETVNGLLQRLDVPLSVKTLDDCVPTLWVALFEGLFQTRLPDVQRPATTHQSRVFNVKLVLTELSATVLGADLSHIAAEDVASGDRRAVRHLVQIFGELGQLLFAHDNGEEEEKRESYYTSEREAVTVTSDGSGRSYASHTPMSSIGTELDNDSPPGLSDVSAIPKIDEGEGESYVSSPDSRTSRSHTREESPPSRISSPTSAQPRGQPVPRRQQSSRRFRSSRNEVLTDVGDDIEEFARMRSSQIERQEDPYEAYEANSVGTRRMSTQTPIKPTAKRARSLLNPLPTDTPFTKALKRRRLQHLNIIKTPKPKTLKPNRRRQPRYEPSSPPANHSALEDDDDASSVFSRRDPESHRQHRRVPLAETNLRVYQREIDRALPAALVDTGMTDARWSKQVKAWERALDDRLWGRKVRKHQEEDAAREIVGPALQQAKSMGDSLLSEDHLPRTQHDILLRARAAQREQRRRVIAADNRVREAARVVEKHRTVLRDKDEQLVKHLYDTYTRRQREAIIDARKDAAAARAAAKEIEQRKRDAEAKFHKDQLDLLRQQLAEAKRDEEIVVKAHAEELRKLVREQKDAAKRHIKRVKDKLDVDVADLVFREADAVGVAHRVQFGYH
ncbi:Centrosomal protein of 95 kDa [Geranomyces variabilis]|uniref:Centrosomal protein of 95 kDa n=1 Tax=Geranomyces variabilis TaxID=109894 RepID=A0AAD5XRF0_9FUNG|nr:Centrosomal protein of 95 kDa [Geranomyces variabilis]